MHTFDTVELCLIGAVYLICSFLCSCGTYVAGRFDERVKASHYIRALSARNQALRNLLNGTKAPFHRSN